MNMEGVVGSMVAGWLSLLVAGLAGNIASLSQLELKLRLSVATTKLS